MTEELDAGEVLGQSEVPIEPGDTPETLQQVLNGFDTAPARANTASCIPTEKVFFAGWLERAIESCGLTSVGPAASGTARAI